MVMGVNPLFSAVARRLNALKNRANHEGTQPISSIDSLSEWLLNGRKRGNHTGTQPMNTVDGLETAIIDSRNRANHTGVQPMNTIEGLSDGLATVYNRANHTGTQPISSVVGLELALQAHGDLFVMSAGQTVPVNVNTRVKFDAASNYPTWISPTNNRITPKVEGSYLLVVSVNMEVLFYSGGTKNNISRYRLNILKNGALQRSAYVSGYNEDFNTVQLLGNIRMNGTTDYLEAFIHPNIQNASGINILTSPTETGFGLLYLGKSPV